MTRIRAGLLGLVAAVAAAALPARGETLLSVDATQTPAAPETGYLHMGADRSPDGRVIGINSRYLTLDGRPWLPVMGEMHFTRSPARDWDDELAKMKAAGVDIVSTYIFWLHHEEVAGRFDWTGDRDLRRFVELCAKHHLKVLLRLGPWAHGEARYGGIPAWLVDEAPTRSDDPVYLGHVARFWSAIGAQTRGLLWKDGGPIIGIQLENEYNLTGPGQGRGHIASLKRLALAAGFDVPLYTVTGWDGAVYPPREVTPLEGGYPDEPWGVSTTPLPPKETYAFRFDSRVSGNLGATTARTSAGDADPDIPHTPFLAAEFGGGLPAMYRRRPVLTPDDVAAMLPVQLGSGVNLYGYYMFHGGVNPEGRGDLQESTGSGGYNDLPLKDYDFQAPLGAYGQAHPVLDKLRPFHAFLAAFGPELAPMTPRRPAVLPRGLDDLATPRFSVRSLGDRGFLFVSNHVRQYAMAAQAGVRFQVDLPGGSLIFPSRPIDIPTDAYFIWPINLDLGDPGRGGARLAWATAQPVTRLQTAEGPVVVLHAVDGIPAEFAIEGAAAVTAESGSVATDSKGRRIVGDLGADRDQMIRVRLKSGGTVRLLLLTARQAGRLWILPIEGTPHLLLTAATAFETQGGLELRSKGDPAFDFAVFPALARAPTADTPLRAKGRAGAFETYAAQVPPRVFQATLAPLREAHPVPPLATGGLAGAALEPSPETFGKAAGWTITVPGEALDGVAEAYLDIRFKGDVARLFAGDQLLDDQFWNGQDWEVGLKRFADRLGAPLTLTILPLRSDAPIYLDAAARARLPATGQTAAVERVAVTPEYRLRLSFP